MDGILLNIRQLACFCPECMDNNPAFCEKYSHVRPWMMKVMQPLEPLPVSELCVMDTSGPVVLTRSQIAEGLQYSGANKAGVAAGGGDSLWEDRDFFRIYDLGNTGLHAADVPLGDGVGMDFKDDLCGGSDDEVDIETESARVEVGDNYVVISDRLEEGDPFFVVLCDTPVHLNERTFVDGWGCTWPRECMLISGTYYRRLATAGRDKHALRYELLVDQPRAWNYSHLVLQSWVELIQYKTKKGNPWYRMPVSVRESILSNIKEQQAYNAH